MSERGRVVAISTNPALDRVLVAPGARGGGLVHATDAFETPGGKAAQAVRIAAALGADVVLVAALGGARGAHYRRLLEQRGISSRLVEVAGETRQTLSIVDEGDLLEIHEPCAGLTGEEADGLVHVAEDELAGARVAIVSGSLPPGAPADLHARLVRAARAQGAFVVLDSSTPEAFAAAADERPDLIKPNLEEANRMQGGSPVDMEDQRGAAQLAAKLAARFGTSVWLTLGAGGSVVVSAEQVMWLTLTPRTAVRNAVGAGDALLGGLGAGLVRGLSLVEAARLGVAAAADSVTREASATIDRVVVEDTRAHVQVWPIEGLRGASS